MNPKRFYRSAFAGSVVEMVVSLALLLPVVVAIVLVVVEATMAYHIHTGLQTATRRAARDFAAAYGQSETFKTDNAAQNAVLSSIRVPGVVVSNRQFRSPDSPNPVFDENDPPSVTVYCTYTGGKYGLPVFPNPDPLNLKSKPSFKLMSVASYRLE